MLGTWSESGGLLVQSSGSTPANMKYNDDISLTDYILEVKAKKTGGPEGFLVAFRAGSYLPWWNLGGWGNTLSKVENIDGTIVGSLNTVATNVWYNIQIKVIYSENRYVGAIGTGIPVEQWDTVDTVIGQAPAQYSNKICLATWATQVEYDNWRIRKYAVVEPAAEVVRHYAKSASNLPLSEPTALTTSFEYDDYNKLAEITNPDSATETLSYDDNGQLVKSEKSTGEVTTYEWNDQGMLVKVILPNGEPVEYEYDGNQRLISRKSSDGVDNFVQSGWDIVTKMDDVGKRTYYTGMSAVSGGSSVSASGSSSGSSSASSSSSSSGSSCSTASVSGSASESASASDSARYFHYNHRGDTVLVTDANGEILHNLNYEAYGKPTNNEGIPINTLSLSNATDPNNNTYSTGNTSGNTTGGSGGNNLPNLFVGASGIRYDTKTNLHYMRFRWFSSSQMRFISPDLLMDLNRYAYVSGNPVNIIDILGLDEIAVREINRNKVSVIYEVVRWKDKVKDGKVTRKVEYRLPELQDGWDMPGEQRTLIRLAKSEIEIFHKQQKQRIKEAGGGEFMNVDPDHPEKGKTDIIVCSTWRDYFKKREIAKLLQDRIIERYYKKGRLVNIEIKSYDNTKNDKHAYAYLRIILSDNKGKTEVFLLTETDAPPGGLIHYQTYAVPNPDNIVIEEIKKNVRGY